MPREHDASADPYRTLGLEPGASKAEVKRAYRLLAKAFHPDSAGEVAIPRFLAIHAAYEQLTTGKVVAGPKIRQPEPTSEPWRADPARARAARERARSARSGRARAPGATEPGGRTSRGGASGTGTAPSGPPTGTSSTGSRSGRRRSVRKATMGSTSYDEARDPSDATWSGASWYGPSSGEYWIVNPREYADPRKHGPAYQRRARRPLETEGPEVLAGRFETATAAAADASAGAARPARPASTFARPRVEPSASAQASPRWPGEASAERDPDRVEVLGAATRAWLGGPADDPTRRFGLALVAWPPIGLAAAALIGEVTGCTAYSAGCGGAAPLLPWLAQAAILGLLLLLPPIARLLAGGAIGVFIALIPVTAVLLAVGASGVPQAGITMAVLLGAAWLVGIGWTARTSRRRARSGSTA